MEFRGGILGHPNTCDSHPPIDPHTHARAHTQHLAARVRHHGLDAGSGGARILKTIAGACIVGAYSESHSSRFFHKMHDRTHTHTTPFLLITSGAWIVGLDAEGGVRIWCILHPSNPQPGDPKLPDQVKTRRVQTDDDDGGDDDDAPRACANLVKQAERRPITTTTTPNPPPPFSRSHTGGGGGGDGARVVEGVGRLLLRRRAGGLRPRPAPVPFLPHAPHDC